MNISFLGNYDIASLLALNYLSPYFDTHRISIFYSKKTPSNKNSAPSLRDLANFDLALVNKANGFLSFEQLNAEELNDINGRDYNKFASQNADLVVSIRHMSILKERVINTPRCGVLNLHSGLLPDYQGVMATFRAMSNKEPTLGTCLHFIEDSGIDTGAIIDQTYTAADYQRSYLWNVLNIYRSGCHNLLKAINSISRGKELASTQQQSGANYYSYPSQKEIDSAEFKLFSVSDDPTEFRNN